MDQRISMYDEVRQSEARLILTASGGSLAKDQYHQAGLQYRRNRYYDPMLGPFTQEDPIGIAGGLNTYGYANGDPVNFSDPFGLCPVPGAEDEPCVGIEGIVVTVDGDTYTCGDNYAACAPGTRSPGWSTGGGYQAGGSGGAQGGGGGTQGAYGFITPCRAATGMMALTIGADILSVVSLASGVGPPLVQMAKLTLNEAGEFVAAYALRSSTQGAIQRLSATGGNALMRESVVGLGSSAGLGAISGGATVSDYLPFASWGNARAQRGALCAG